MVKNFQLLRIYRTQLYWYLCSPYFQSVYFDSASIQAPCTLKRKENRHLDCFNKVAMLLLVSKRPYIWTYAPNRPRIVQCYIYCNCFSYIFYSHFHLYFFEKRGRETSQQRTQSKNRVSGEEFLKTIITVAFVKIIILAPTSIDRLISGWSVTHIDDFDNFLEENMIFFEMYSLNSAINPFLYIWFGLKTIEKPFFCCFVGIVVRNF